MHFVAISINHRTADVTLREQVAFRDDALRLAHEDLYETKAILENVILSTCNRTEVYAIVDQVHTGRYYIQRFLARSFGFEVDNIKDMSEVKVGTMQLNIYCVSLLAWIQLCLVKHKF